jgi:hypothetical protein
MTDKILASAIETLIGGTADTFVVCAGPGLPVTTKTAAEVRTLLSVLTSSQIAAAYQPIGSYAASVHTHAGTDITSGTIDPARLGSGASISTKFLRGDSTWQTISGGGDALTSGTLAQFASTTSAELRGVLSDETGTGAAVFATSPTLVTPALGVASAATVNKVAITAPATGSTLTIADGKTFTASNSITIAGTDGSTLNVGAGGTLGTLATKSTYTIQIALSGYDQAVSAGTKKGQCRVPYAGTITGFAITCDPANEPSAAAIQCDLNTVNLSTGALTSVLTSVASIATGANISTGGAISGSPSVSAGDQLAIDIDQGSDGKGLLATITITAT